MNVLTIDCETTISNNGSPFDKTNRLVCVGLKTNYNTEIIYFPCSHEDHIYIQEYIDNADVIIGFNIKFDLHWLKNIDIDFSGKRIWDCQLGEFLLENQQNPYPSLNQAAEKYGLGTKIDVVKNEFWDKGIDTDCIPREILSEYLEQDLVLTEQVYLKQIEQFKTNGKLPLMRLHCADLLVLQEMEYNGIVFKTKEAMEYASNLDQELQALYSKLVSIIGNVPININSNDHLSALFYGGIIAVDERIPIGVYKSGNKVGHPRYKILVKEYVLPRLVEPIESTETAKSKELERDDPHRTWRTSEDVLRSLKVNKQAKEIVDLVGKYSKIEKLKGTYLEGYTKLIEKMNWEEDMLHGTLNQCVAVTGRLSSTKPNLQNADSTTKLFMTTRYI